MRIYKKTEQEVIDALKRVLKGESLRDVAKDIGVSHQLIHTWCRRANIDLSNSYDWVKIRKELRNGETNFYSHNK